MTTTSERPRHDGSSQWLRLTVPFCPRAHRPSMHVDRDGRHRYQTVETVGHSPPPARRGPSSATVPLATDSKRCVTASGHRQQTVAGLVCHASARPRIEAPLSAAVPLATDGKR
jgi:hypothetical protein